MHSKLGVIDIGTNTFHLLIVNWDTQKDTFSQILRKRVFVKLGTANLGFIDAKAYQRGLVTLKEFKILLLENNCEKYFAFGTSAIRNASNADLFCQDVMETTGIEIQKISGNREAELIYKGIQLSFPFDNTPSMIMDIGGGSVEFIIANQERVFYAASFKIGVGVLSKKFHTIDPIPSDKIASLKEFLNNELAPLCEKLKVHMPQILIGASGTFDVLESILPRHPLSSTANILDTSNLLAFSIDVMAKTIEQRKKIEGIPDTRADLIVVALILINFVLEKHTFDQLVVSKYSMKEGMLSEMMNE